MRVAHKWFTALAVVVGVVVAVVLTTGAGWSLPQPKVATPVHHQPAVTPITGPTYAEVQYAATQAAAQAEADAIAALNAQQAQELADRLQKAAQTLQNAPGPTQAATPAPVSGDCWGVNRYAAFIYQHESGCRTDAVNGGGCAGIGQACPGSKMPCSLSDAPCQLAYFESYALGRYGSWEAAYQFWVSHGWW